MIYTLTLNPAIDYIVSAENFKLGALNRSDCAQIEVGGKGINVSLMLKQLGFDSTALGFIAGFTGEAIKNGVTEKGIVADFIKLSDGNSRINIKLKTDVQTEINASGPVVPQSAEDELLTKIDRLKSGDTFIISGSVPSVCSEDIYEKILSRLKNRGVIFAADTTGRQLLQTLKYKPFIIKPNNIELGELFDVEIKTPEEALPYAKRLQLLGARNVLISFAEKGAALLDEQGDYHTIASPKGEAVNPSGAGDSMLAAFLAGYFKTQDYSYALKLGCAAGAATAFSVGIAEKDKIIAIFNSL